MKTYTFHVQGMHCNACVLMIEGELQDIPHITYAKSSLKHHSVEVTGDFGDKSEEEIVSELSKVLEKYGYTLTVDKQIKEKKWSDFKVAVPIALVFAFLFIFLQKIGLVNLVGG